MLGADYWESFARMSQENRIKNNFFFFGWGGGNYFIIYPSLAPLFSFVSKISILYNNKSTTIFTQSPSISLSCPHNRGSVEIEDEYLRVGFGTFAWGEAQFWFIVTAITTDRHLLIAAIILTLIKFELNSVNDLWRYVPFPRACFSFLFGYGSIFPWII